MTKIEKYKQLLSLGCVYQQGSIPMDLSGLIPIPLDGKMFEFLIDDFEIPKCEYNEEKDRICSSNCPRIVQRKEDDWIITL